MSKPEPKLEPLACPFCNLPPTVREHRYSDETGERVVYVGIECTRHEAGGNESTLICGVHAETEAEAIAAWNKRVPASEPTEAQVEAAAEAMHEANRLQQIADCLRAGHTPPKGNPVFMPWKDWPEDFKPVVRNIARAALTAALAQPAEETKP